MAEVEGSQARWSGLGQEAWTNLSFRRLAQFLVVAEAGSISAAAERLFMSQSGLAGSLAEMERTLGADLVVRRRGRGISLTPTGLQVQATARSLLGEASELGRLAQGEGSELTGPLVVGCFVTLAPTVLPRLRVDFAALHPKVTFDFIEGAQDTLQEKLLNGELDLAVMYDMELSASLDWFVLYEARAYALFGEGNPLAKRASVTLELLADEPLILFDTTPSSSYAMSLFEARGLRPRIAHRTHSYELTRSLVARSASEYAILVQRPTNRLSYEGLPIVEREIEPEPASCPVILAWSKGHRLSSRARALAALARSQYSVTGASVDPPATLSPIPAPPA